MINKPLKTLTIMTGEQEKIYVRARLPVSAPKGWEFTGEFRKPEIGEDFLTDTLTQLNAKIRTFGPRFILQKEQDNKQILQGILKEKEKEKGKMAKTIEVAQFNVENPVEKFYQYLVKDGVISAPEGYEFTGEWRTPNSSEVFGGEVFLGKPDYRKETYVGTNR